MPPATFSGYPGSIGAKNFALAPNCHAGPASYTQLSGGGDVLYAVDFGFKNFEHVWGGLTSDGLYRVEPVNPKTGPVPSLALRWTVVSTGAQVAGAVDLSASSVNLAAIGV